MRSSVHLLMILTTLTGCIGPCYTPPAIDTPITWRTPSDEGSTLCNLSWWEQFNDPVLNELIAKALKNNQDIQVAVYRVWEYYSKVGIVNSKFLPHINGTATYDRIRASQVVPQAEFIPPGVSPTFNEYIAFFDVSWYLDFWGKLSGASHAACADLLASVEARRAVVLTVVSEVANAYIELRGLDSQLAISKKTLGTRLGALKLAESRFKQGETSQIEVTQAESEAEIAAIRVLEFQREIPKKENLISILIGENPNCIERGVEINAFKYPITIPAGIPSDLLARRPDIVEAEEKLIAANARITEARALYFPQITLTARYGSESVLLSKFLTHPATIWQYGVSAVQAIFDAGERYWNVQQVTAIRCQALYTYKQTILNAFREVEDSLIDYEKDRQLVVEYQRQIKVLSDYLHLATLRYREGEIDYLNVLDAERQLFDAELNMVEAQANSFKAVVELYSALGGGWVTEADTIQANDQATCDCN